MQAGHFALAALEKSKRLGVTFEDKEEFYSEFETSDWMFSSGQRELAIITQNVDSLHRRAGSAHVSELHGRTDIVKCMSCGLKRNRNDFHAELELVNREWLEEALGRVDNSQLRPDGDAALQKNNYDSVQVPPCPRCGGFVKPGKSFARLTVSNTPAFLGSNTANLLGSLKFSRFCF
mgnify:CR=1 FL=1